MLCDPLMQNSPYAEVRAVVDNHDDIAMPASTFRAWFIGTIFVVAGCVDPAEPTVLLAPIYRLAVSQGFRQPVLQHSPAHHYGLR